MRGLLGGGRRKGRKRGPGESRRGKGQSEIVRQEGNIIRQERRRQDEIRDKGKQG